MTEYLIIIVQVFLITVFSVISLFLFRAIATSKKERRLSRFTVDALNRKKLSFFDILEIKYSNILKQISKILKKSKLFSKYSKKYEKYLDENETIRKDSMDFISNKICIALIITIITIISNILRVKTLLPIEIILIFIVGFYVSDIYLYFRGIIIKREIENDLLKAVTIMNNAFKSGRSIMQAVELVSTELDGVISDEFRKMYIDLTYGLDLKTVFNRFALRVKLDEIKYMASSLIILNKTGGDVSKVFDSIEKSFFARKKLKDELKSATSMSELVFKILIFLPILIFILVFIFNRTYFNPLFFTSIGRIILVIVLVIYVLYIIVVKRVTKLKE